MLKNYLIVGADTCIGYALCKRLMIEEDFCIYGINTKFNHYGNKCFQYAFNRNLYDEPEVYRNNNCRAYLLEKNYDVVFWCDAVWTDDEDTDIYDRVNQFFQIMDGIRYQRLYFWVKEQKNSDGREPELPTEKSVAIKIPNVYGIYQEKGDIIPRIILNDKAEELRSSELSEKFLSAWSIAEAVIDNNLEELQEYTFTLPLKDLVFLMEDLKKEEMFDLNFCCKFFQTDDEGKVRRIIYNLLEVIEFYISNEMYYREKE
jgi:hypothetical protein